MYYKGTAPSETFMPRALLIFPITLSLFGQSTQPSAADSYATTDDGGQLYFVSNFLLRGSTGETTTPKLFKYDGTNFSLVVQIPYAVANDNPIFYALLSPRISGDGSVVGYVATQGCGNSCSVKGGYQTTLQFPGQAAPLTLPYYCQISRNAQYALCVTAQPSLQQVAIVNLSTMQMSPSQLTACHGRNLITSDGRAVAWNQQEITLFSATGAQHIASDSYGCPVISDDGSVIVYPSHSGVIVFDVAAGTSRAITPPCNVCNFQSPGTITSDGTEVLVGGVLMRTNGSGSTPVNADDGNGDIMSGDGRVVYFGLSKIDVATGAITQLAQPTPQFFPQPFYVPGSYCVVPGENLSTTSDSAASFPGPTALAGVQVLINGTAIPLISVSPTALTFQLPWETPLSASVAVTTSTGSQFVQGPVHLEFDTFQPKQLGPAVNETFTAVNSQTSPANPGDVVTFYVSGMGAVTVSVPDNVPTPASPLPVLANAITASYFATPLKIYYAGLAPGLIGIYQLTLQTPSHVSAPPNGGVAFVELGFQLLPPQTAVPYALTLWMNPNQ
jgi:uncharacterized protein (TIGR03437 family)